MRSDSVTLPSFVDWLQRCRSDAAELVQRSLRAAGLQHQAGLREAWLMKLERALSGPGETSHPVRSGLPSGIMLMSEAEVSEGVVVQRLVQDMHTAADWLLVDIHARGEPLWRTELADGQWPHAALLHPSLLADTLCQALRVSLSVPQQRLDLLSQLATPLTRLLNPLYERQLEWLELHGVSAHQIAPSATSMQLAEAPRHSADSKTVSPKHEPYPPSLPMPAVGITATQVPALLARMAQQAGLDAGMTLLMADLAMALQRSVEAHPEMLSDEQGVTWRLVERLVALGQLYPLHQPGKLPLEQRMAPLIERLQRSKQPAKDSAYQRVLDHVEQMHLAALKTAAEAQRQTEAHLDVEVRRDELEPLILFQMMDRLSGQDPQPEIRQFLLGPWVQVLARVSATEGVDGPGTQRWTALVDTLIEKGAQDLHTPLGPAELECLLMDLREGLSAGAHSEERIRSLEADLMTALAEWPRARTVLQAPVAKVPPSLPPEPSTPTPVVPPEAPMPVEESVALAPVDAGPPSEPAPEPAVTQPTPPGSEDVLSSRWAHHSELETVPQVWQDDPPDSPGRLACTAWINGLAAGQMCRIFIQGRWTSARLDWVSDRQRFYSFTRPRNTPFTASRRVLERMRTEGLITTIDPGQWLRAAANSLPMPLE